MANLTRETAKAFKLIFCEYKSRRKNGMSIEDAIQFEAGEIPKLNSFSKWNPNDVDFAISGLISSGYIYSDITDSLKLTDEGITYMENKPKEYFDDIKSLIDIAKIFL